MEFNSQICTTKEQSERLLALGLKRETADMRYQILYLDLGGVLKECTPSLDPYPPLNNDRFIPAWSLHRLIEMTDTYIEFSPFTGVNFQDGPFSTNRDNDYDAIVDIIEWLIQKGHFNKEYLEELCGKH